MKYNESQKRAIAHEKGPFLCLAGPGSGKTSVLTRRIYHLIHQYQIPPAAILVVTFTRAAAREMKERFLQLLQDSQTQVTFGTFHSVFYGILRHAYGLSSQNVLREGQKYEFLRDIIHTSSLETEDEKEMIEDLLKEISMVKINRISLEHYYSTSCPEEAFRTIYEEYKMRCKKSRLLDFDDMLVSCYELLMKREDLLQGWQKKFQYILIDEFQDINQLQYDIMKLLAAPENNMFIAGDDDQSIYGFRGAKPQIMLQFPKEFPEAKKEILSYNYRSSKTILRASQRLISHNKHRFSKNIQAYLKEGTSLEIKSFQTNLEEHQYVRESILQYCKEGHAFEEIAVLYRTNLDARFLVEVFMEYQIPFYVKDIFPNPYEHWIAKDMTAYIRLALGDSSRKELFRIMNRPNRYISRQALEQSQFSFEGLRWFYEEKDWMCDRIDELEENLYLLKGMTPYGAINYIRHGIGYDEYLKEYARYRNIKAEELYEIVQDLQESAKGYPTCEAWFTHIKEYTEKLNEQARTQSEKKEGVTISTLHGIKGLEYQNVYIMNVNEGTVPYRKAVLEEAIEEERRLLYVGMTRAKEKLHIFSVEEKHGKKLEASRFLKEIRRK